MVFFSTKSHLQGDDDDDDVPNQTQVFFSGFQTEGVHRGNGRKSSDQRFIFWGLMLVFRIKACHSS